MTYFLIYKTINTLNGRYYVGAHQCQSLEDGYLGSGKVLTEAIAKYGKASFTRYILFYCGSSKEMFTKEAEIVTQDLISDPLSYNIKIGGKGGWNHINDVALSDEVKERRSSRMSASRTGNTNNRGKKRSAEYCARRSAHFKGREIIWRDKISKAKTGKITICHVGQRINKIVSREEADYLLAQGWERGQYKSKLQGSWSMIRKQTSNSKI